MSEDFQSMKHLKLPELTNIERNLILHCMFQKQFELSMQYDWQNGKTQEEMTQIFAQAIASEAQELMNNCNWKPWKETKKEFNREETIYEYIDILHFVINGLLALDVTAEQCMQYYLAKNGENNARIERKY